MIFWEKMMVYFKLGRNMVSVSDTSYSESNLWPSAHHMYVQLSWAFASFITRVQTKIMIISFHAYLLINESNPSSMQDNCLSHLNLVTCIWPNVPQVSCSSVVERPTTFERHQKHARPYYMYTPDHLQYLHKYRISIHNQSRTIEWQAI